MIRELHHIGIAVHSIDEALPRWVDGLGLELIGIDEVPAEQVRVAVLRAGSTRIELLEPTAEDSPVGKFLAKRGPGIHHVALQTDDVENEVEHLSSLGGQIIGAGVGPGAHGTRVAFLHPKSNDGVLTEIVEDPHHPPGRSAEPDAIPGGIPDLVKAPPTRSGSDKGGAR